MNEVSTYIKKAMVKISVYVKKINTYLNALDISILCSMSAPTISRCGVEQRFHSAWLMIQSKSIRFSLKIFRPKLQCSLKVWVMCAAKSSLHRWLSQPSRMILESISSQNGCPVRLCTGASSTSWSDSSSRVSQSRNWTVERSSHFPWSHSNAWAS